MTDDEILREDAALIFRLMESPARFSYRIAVDVGPERRRRIDELLRERKEQKKPDA